MRAPLASRLRRGLSQTARVASGALALAAVLGWGATARANITAHTNINEEADEQIPIQRPSRVGTASVSADVVVEPPISSTPASTPTASTSSKAPPPSLPLAEPSREPAASSPPAPTARRTTPRANEGGLRTTHEPRKEERLPHRGFTFDGRVGTAGCLGSLCANRHRASPGVRLDGFLGGNIRGWVDLGVAGGWGTFNADVEQDENLLRLYGIEPAHLQAAAVGLGRPLSFNPFALQVRGTKLRSARVGPALRIHLIPRGRGIAYVGSGFGYSTFIADYQTATGPASMRLHGFDVPVQAGAGVQVLEHLAIVAQFDYTFTRYPLVQFEHPQEALTLPVAILDDAAAQSGNSVTDSLPQYWSVGVGLRARF